MDVVPELYRKELSVLQNGVPPKPPHEVHAMIAEQLGKSVGELFATFDDKPVGSASIGQVHRATLKDGRDVVVKVQYPEVRQLFESDFTQLVGACYFWRPEALNEMREFRRQFMCEFDFRREARVMRQIRSNLGTTGRRKGCLNRAAPPLIPLRIPPQARSSPTWSSPNRSTSSSPTTCW